MKSFSVRVVVPMVVLPCALLLLCSCRTSAFVVMAPSPSTRQRLLHHNSATVSSRQQKQQETSLAMIPLSNDADILYTLASHHTSNWIATIDGDIAKISDNEFAPVFLGGIAVMFGGVLSATILGAILEKGDLYANVVADSYIQGGGNDEEFWKGLSEEERIKGQEILKQLEAKKRGEVYVPQVIGSEPTTRTTSSRAPEQEVTTGAGSSKKEMDMFSDYE